MPGKNPLHYYIIPALIAALSAASPKLPAAFGEATALLLSEPLAVRPLGMAGAFAATADDESAIQSNPAGLARVQGISLEAGHMLGLLGAQVSHLSLATSLAN